MQAPTERYPSRGSSLRSLSRLLHRGAWVSWPFEEPEFCSGHRHNPFHFSILRIAKRLNLRDEVSTGMVFMSGRVQAENATLPSLQLGSNRTAQSSHHVIADISALQRFVPVRIDGILGLDVLGQTPFVIDYTAHVIRFGPSPALAISVPLRLGRRGLGRL